MKNCMDETVIDVDDGKKSKECIFRVPRVLRRQKPEAYTPDVVSIGPFHMRKGKEEDDFQIMERVKQTYLDEICSDMDISLEELTAKVTDELSEKRARGFYAEPLDHITSEDFIKMMMVDGFFLIQLFRKCNNRKLRAVDDPVFNMDCMFHFLCHDILLLENQLPWFVLTTLYHLTLDPIQPHEPSLSLRILKAFTRLPSLKQSCSSYIKHLNKDKFHCDANVLHILDLIRASIVIPLKTKDEAAEEAKLNAEEEDSEIDPNAEEDESEIDPDQHQMQTATALSKADIKFRSDKKDKKESIMDIEFKEVGYCRNGVLKIPQLNVGMSSETLFRNLIALEQCYHYHGRYSNAITSYAILMDNLISSKEDMELLCKEKVIGNWLSDEDGCNFFNNLHKDIPHNNFYYKDLCDRVNARYKLKRYTWLALLKIENFSNPWKILAFVVAIIALSLSSWASINNIRRHM